MNYWRNIMSIDVTFLLTRSSSLVFCFRHDFWYFAAATAAATAIQHPSLVIVIVTQRQNSHSVPIKFTPETTKSNQIKVCQRYWFDIWSDRRIWSSSYLPLFLGRLSAAAVNQRRRWRQSIPKNQVRKRVWSRERVIQKQPAAAAAVDWDSRRCRVCVLFFPWSARPSSDRRQTVLPSTDRPAL